MNKKDRKFAVPFNGMNSKRYLDLLKPYLDNIDQVYMGIPTLAPNHQNIITDSQQSYADILNYEYNCLDFLANTVNFPFKRFITLNSPVYNWETKDYLIFVHKNLAELVNNLKIDGVILADFELGLAIKSVFPDLELQTSCNAYMWNLINMRRWKEELGVEVFNPPREILRTKDKLKEMHDAGFKLKCIVNENCVYGCPSNLNHCIQTNNTKNFFFYKYCEHCSLDNVFKGNWILPRHLKLYDDYVSIFKLVGRSEKEDALFETIDAYINERDDINLLECVQGRMNVRLKGVKIPTRIIPDKLLTCECKECTGNNKTCKVCEKLLEKVMKNQQLSSL